MKKRMVLVSLAFVLLTGALLWQAGCRLGGGEGSSAPIVGAGGPGVETAPVPATARVSFRFVLPGETSSLSPAPVGAIQESRLAAIRPATATGTPTVTVKLILVNVGNASQPMTTLSKTVTVDASGTAEVTFPAVPALTCIGDLTITGGEVSGFTQFHGAADLRADSDNVVEISPVKSQLLADVIAYVARQMVSSSYLYPKVTSGMAGKIRSLVLGLNLQPATVYDDAITAFVSGSLASSTVVLGTGAVILDDSSLAALSSLSNDGNSLTFETPTAMTASLTVGTILIGDATEVASQGILKKITAIASLGNGIVVQTTPVSIEEAILDCNYEYYGPMLDSSPLSRASLRRGVRVDIIPGRTNLKLFNTLSFGTGAKLGIDFDMPRPRLYYHLETRMAAIKNFTLIVEGSADTAITLTSIESVSLYQDVETPNLTLAYITLPGPVGGVPLVIPLDACLVGHLEGN